MANSTFSRNNKIIIAAAAALLLIAILLITSGDRRNGDNSGSYDISKAKLESGEVRVSGTITCLPVRSGSSQDCIKALKGSDDKIYALDGSSALTAYSEGTRITAIGTYAPADTSSEESSFFQYDGVLTVREFAQQ